MQSLVFQSFRTVDVPSWMQACLDSVACWARKSGFAYEFIDDRFFNYAPPWYRKAVRNQRHLVADLARLELAKQFLEQGWERVIWVDADVFISNVDGFVLDESSSFLFCRELWVAHSPQGLTFSERVNNAVMVLRRDNPFLEFYRYACEQIVRTRSNRLTHTDVGTAFLSRLCHYLQTPLIQNVALLSPVLLKAYADLDHSVLEEFHQRFAAPIHATNLCLTFRGQHMLDRKFDDAMYQQVLERLQELHSGNE